MFRAVAPIENIRRAFWTTSGISTLTEIARAFTTRDDQVHDHDLCPHNHESRPRAPVVEDPAHRVCAGVTSTSRAAWTGACRSRS